MRVTAPGYRLGAGSVKAIAAAAALAGTAWEIARPSLPVPFELAAAARAAGAPTWAGRLPMAAWAALGMAALYIFIARVVERRTAAYAIAILATTPAWFVHGRTMTGAIVPMAGFAIILATLGVAALDVNARARVRVVAVIACVVAATVSCVTRGEPGRGLVVVVAVPAIGVGLASLLWRHDDGGGRRIVGMGVLGAGAAIAIASFVALAANRDGTLTTLLVGARAPSAGSPVTGFDAPVAVLAYGLVPWTPLVPLAIAARPPSAGHLAITITAILAVAAHAALAPRSGIAPLVGVAAIAGAVAGAVRRLEDAPRPQIAMAATVLTLGALLAHDIALSPDRALVAFGPPQAIAPAAQAKASALAIRSSQWLLIVLAAIAIATPRGWLPVGRGLAIVSAGVLAGLVLRAHAYPELLGRLSPGAAFDAWSRKHREEEGLGLVGVDRRAVAFVPGTAVVAHGDARAAGRWIANANANANARRFLAIGVAELPRVNAEFRALRGVNVPVIAGKGSTTLLGVSELRGDERSENPLDGIVMAVAPEMRRPIGAVLEDRLEVIGWEVVDREGRPVDAVPRGKAAHVRVAIRVREGTTPLEGRCTFLHIDHAPARFNAEHREHPYPMRLWRTGDVVMDDFEVKLQPHFRSGRYPLFWGVGVLPCEDDRRMHVTAGPSDGKDRVPGGALEVR